MDILLAILLGMVEGLTEFLPISSTGHLLVAQELVAFKDAARLFTVVIQVGAIAAVVWYYRFDIWQKLLALRTKEGLLFWWRVFVACLPAVALGMLTESWLDKHTGIGIVAAALLLGGLVLLLVERHIGKRVSGTKNTMNSITTKQALIIGLAQVTALVPGVSRSGATIVGGMYAGLNRVSAAAFSFYISMPIIAGASGYKLIKHHSDLPTVQGGLLAITAGTIAAFISALAVVSWLLKYISKHDFKPFAWYRIGFGFLLFLLLLVGAL